MASNVLQDASQQSSNGTIVDSWARSPYGVRLVEDPQKMFKTLIEVERFVLEVDGKGPNGELNANIQKWMNVLESTSFEEAFNGEVNRPGLNDEIGEFSSAHGRSMYSAPNYTDTRVGGNDAINPYWQFNRDDDIVPPMFQIPNVGEEVTTGMGRVYSEMYDDHQEILWMRMGVPEYVNIIEFFQASGNADASYTMKAGTIRGLVGKIIRTTVSATIWAITFPIMAPLHIMRWIKDVDAERITAYYKFQPAMVLYYEMVNTMMSYLAVGMGLYPVLWQRRRDPIKNLANDAEDAQKQQSKSQPEESPTLTGGSEEINRTAPPNTTLLLQSDDIQELAANKTGNFDSGIPELLRNGPDIYVILNRRSRLFNSQRVNVTTRELLEEGLNDNAKAAHYEEPYPYKIRKADGTYREPEKKDPKRFGRTLKEGFNNFVNALKGNMFGAGDYVGFRIERGVNCTESFSNQTRQTSISQKLNQVSAQKKDEMDSTFGGNMLMRLASRITSGDSVDSFMKMIGLELAAKATSVVGATDLATIIATGSGYLNIPEVWDNSSFNKSYNFTVNLKSRYGDPVSIYQSIYIPLIMLLAAALPRSIGDNMYTSPFLINAYCKGKFAVPCGIIGNMSITRGKDDYGWNNSGLPTSVDVSFDIHDLSPALFISMQDIGIFDTFKRNNELMEYLDTLSALSITEKLYTWPKIQRKAAAAWLINMNTVFSPTYWGFRLGRTTGARFLAALTPFGNYEKSDIQYNSSRWANVDTK